MLQHIMLKHLNTFIFRNKIFVLLIKFAKMKTGNMVIDTRFGIIDDASIIALLAEETFRESWTEEGNECDVDTYVNENFTQEKVKEEITKVKARYLLALDDRYPVAYVKLESHLQPDGFELEKPISVSRVYVRKLFQGKGIGFYLLNLCVKLAQEEGFKTMWLGVWNENYRALRLYEQFGFERFGMYQFIMGTAVSDDYLMMRKL